jgi:serine/threonine protein kinase
VFAVLSKTDPELRYVAKEIQVTQLSQKKQREALAEVELLRALSHPHIVTCVDALLLGGALYIVMECANGGDLGHHIRAQKECGERFSERTVLATFAQLAAALHFVHSRKILHRDLKPANVFVFGSGELGSCTVKLGDFGLGKMFEGTTFEALSVVGSPSYFSPEVCNGKPYGRKSDVWSLGALLYELACLEVPFLAKTILAVAVLICKTEAKALPNDYSESLRTLVEKMLQKDPAARPAMKVVVQDACLKEFLPALPAAALSESLGVSQTLHETLTSTQGTQSAIVSPSGDSGLTAVSPSGLSTLSEAQTSCQNRALADIIEASFKEHDLGKLGTVPTEVLGQLLQLVVPSLSNNVVLQILAAAGCQGEAVEINKFLEWLCQ